MTLSDDFLSEVSEAFGTDFLSQDSQTLKTYGGDWTKEFEPSPSAVVRPNSTPELSRFLSLCHRHGVAVVPSGGRTGLAAGAVATSGEVVLSLERMNSIGEVDRAGGTLRVQAGAITAAVRAHCEEVGLTWPVQFASDGSSFIGGNIATNAGGVRVLRYGSVRQWVLGLQVVLMDGQVLELNGALEKNNTGIDLKHLFIGSEGILGVITEATLKLTKPPGPSRVFFFSLENMTCALRLLEAVRTQDVGSVLSFEVMFGKSVELVSQVRGIPIPCGESAELYALVELEVGDESDDLMVWLEEILERGIVSDGAISRSSKDSKNFWALREGLGEVLAGQGMLHKNDVSVPVAELPRFVEKLLPLLKESQSLLVHYFGHMGDGNLHINVVKPKEMDKQEFMKNCSRVDEVLFGWVKECGGSISAEHGVGLLKKEFLHYSRSPLELKIFGQLKALFDPKGLLNPGKVIP